MREWIDRWLVTMAPKIRPSTLRDYRNGLARVSERLGHIKLQALKPLDVEEFYASLLQEGHRYGGGLAPKTVRNVHIALRRSLADAERFGLVTRNVAAAVKPPVPERRELQTWTTDEVRQFLTATRDDRLAAAWRLLATTGMRRGEVLGLRWAAVDLKRGRLQINRALSIVDDELVWDAPKTARSRRAISIDDETVAVLKEHRKRQLEERVRAGSAWAERDLVFCDELGGELHPDRFTRAFTQAARTRGPEANPPPRSPPHVGHARVGGRRASQGRERAPRSRHDQHHARPLQPRPARARRAGRERRRQPVRRRRTRVAVNNP